MILMADARNMDDIESCQSILDTFSEKYRRQDFKPSTKPIFATSYSMLKRSWTVKANCKE